MGSSIRAVVMLAAAVVAVVAFVVYFVDIFGGAPPQRTGVEGPRPPAAAGLAEAADIRFQLPVACALGTDCWVFNYVDVDGREGSRRDYNCGELTYDGHKGTDFAIRDLGQMARGVPVLAAAAGIVAGVRDGMADANFRDLPPEEVADKECGNGVRLRHDGGWTTQYCHMKQGSIGVEGGERVSAGQTLGLVGLSGRSEFPHLHFQIENGGRPVDPFVGLDRRIGGEADCGAGPAPLWRDGLTALMPYKRSLVYNGGFAATKPTREAVRRGEAAASTLPRNTRPLYLWADIRGPRKGDRVSFRMTGPDGRKMGKADTIVGRNRALSLQVLTVNTERPWPAGRYEGEVRITGGDGVEYDALVRHVVFE